MGSYSVYSFYPDLLMLSIAVAYLYSYLLSADLICQAYLCVFLFGVPALVSVFDYYKQSQTFLC